MTDSSNRKLRISEVAKIALLPNVYMLGPYPRFIGIAGRQKTAFSLIEELHELGKLTEATRVAVVGRGVTAYSVAALLAKKEISFSFFEVEHLDISKLGENLDHRYIHPSINFWPFEEESEDYEEFAFLNWLDRPTGNFKAEFKEFLEKNSRAFNDFHENTRVESISVKPHNAFQSSRHLFGNF